MEDRRKLVKLRHQIAQARLEADMASASAQSLKTALSRCNAGIEEDDKAVASVTKIVEREKQRVVNALDKVARQKLRAHVALQKTKQSTEQLKSASQDVSTAKRVLETALVSTKRDVAIASDLKRKRDDALSLAKSTAHSKQNTLQVKEAYALPKVLNKALAEAEHNLPQEQQTVRDAAASYERARQVKEMTQKVMLRHKATAKKTIAAVVAATEDAKNQEAGVLRTEQKAKQSEATLMTKKEAELHQERKVLLREDHGPSSALLKRVHQVDLANEEALSNVEDIAKQLMNSVSDNSKTKLLKDLESAKIKERDAKHRQLAAHLTLSQAKMEANLAEQEHNVDLKERQQSVMHAVASTEKNLVRARLLAAESSIKDSKLKRKSLRRRLAVLKAELHTAKSESVRKALLERINAVGDNIQKINMQMKLANESITSGKIELAMKREHAEGQKEAHSAQSKVRKARQEDRRIREKITVIRDELASSDPPTKGPAIFQRLKVLEAKKKLMVATEKQARQKLQIANRKLQMAELKRQYLRVGRSTRQWAFLEQARRKSQRASAAVDLASEVSKERQSKVGMLKESLQMLKHPVGINRLSQMLRKVLERERLAAATIKKYRQGRFSRLSTEQKQMFRKQSAMLERRLQHAKRELLKQQAKVQSLSTQFEASKSTTKANMKGIKSKIQQQEKQKQHWIKKSTLTKSPEEKALLQQELVVTAKGKQLNEDQMRMAKGNQQDLQERYLKAKEAMQTTAKKVSRLSTIKNENVQRKYHESRKEAERLQSQSTAAEDKRDVERKSLQILASKIAATSDTTHKQKLHALVNKARARYRLAKLQLQAMRLKQKQFWKAQQHAQNIARKDLAVDEVQRGKLQLQKTKAEISKLKGLLKGSKHEQPKLGDEQGQVETKPSAATEAAQSGELRKAIRVQKSVLRDQKLALRTHQAYVKKVQKGIKATRMAAKDMDIQIKEAKEKRATASAQAKKIQVQLLALQHPQGLQHVREKIKIKQKDATAATKEVKQVEEKEARARLVEQEAEKLRKRLELQVKVTNEKKAVLTSRVKVLKATLQKVQDKTSRINLQIQLKTAQQSLRKLDVVSEDLAKSVDHAKVESSSEHQQRTVIEEEVRAFSQEKIISTAQIKQIRKTLESPSSNMPAAQQLKLRKDLQRAKEKRTISSDKLATASKKMKLASEVLHKRLAYRGIAWRERNLKRAKHLQKSVSAELHHVRLQTRSARENVNKNTRLSTSKVTRLQKALAGAVAALDSLRGVKDMHSSRDKLRQKIVSLKLSIKQQLNGMRILKVKKVSLDQKVNLAVKKVKTATKHQHYAAKRLRRVRILRESDDRIASRLQIRMKYLRFKQVAALAKLDYEKQAREIAALRVQLAVVSDVPKRQQLKENLGAMQIKLQHLGDRSTHLSKQVNFRKKLIQCQSDDNMVLSKQRKLQTKASKLRQHIRKLTHQQLNKSVSHKLDQDARVASAHAAARVAKLEMQRQVATSRAVGSKPQQIDVKLQIANKELKMAQQRAAAAAEADSAEGRARLNHQVKKNKLDLDSALSKLERLRSKAKKSERCIASQQALISETDKQFSEAKIRDMSSKTGNMFDTQHERTAQQLHQLEKQSFQRQLEVDNLTKQKKQFHGALSELMKKLSKVTDAMEQTTLQNLVLGVKQKQAASQAALAIAVERHATAERAQLQQAQQLAHALDRKQVSTNPIPKKSLPQPQLNTAPAHNPSAVHAAIARILQSDPVTN